MSAVYIFHLRPTPQIWPFILPPMSTYAVLTILRSNKRENSEGEKMAVYCV